MSTSLTEPTEGADTGTEKNYVRSWAVFVVLTHLGMLVQLYYYQDSGGFIGPFPAVFVTLSILGLITLVGNSWFSWQYLGKPDLSDMFRIEMDDTSLEEEIEEERETTNGGDP